MTAPTKNWLLIGLMKLCVSYQVFWWEQFRASKSPTSCSCKPLLVLKKNEIMCEILIFLKTNMEIIVSISALFIAIFTFYQSKKHNYLSVKPIANKYSEVVDNTLFFGFKENGSYYTLSESEIGKTEFLKVVEFIERKIESATNTRR